VDEHGPVLGVYEPPFAGLSLLHTERSEGVYWHPDAHAVHVSERAGPFRTILGWWLGARGYALIHGAAVGTDDGAVLIASRGGAGKSTTALACVLNGLLYLGDDFCFVDAAVEPRVYSPLLPEGYSATISRGLRASPLSSSIQRTFPRTRP
jgi:hypothetical protein